MNNLSKHFPHVMFPLGFKDQSNERWIMMNVEQMY